MKMNNDNKTNWQNASYIYDYVWIWEYEYILHEGNSSNSRCHYSLKGMLVILINLKYHSPFIVMKVYKGSVEFYCIKLSSGMES